MRGPIIEPWGSPNIAHTAFSFWILGQSSPQSKRCEYIFLWIKTVEGKVYIIAVRTIYKVCRPKWKCINYIVDC